MYLNDASLLWNLRCRYLGDNIYTYTGYILIAINPYKNMSHIYGDELMFRKSPSHSSVLLVISAGFAERLRRDRRVQGEVYRYPRAARIRHR